MMRRLGFSLVAVGALYTLPARADGASDAERTFQEGLSLYDAGKIAEACVRFAESFALDPALGTLQNLAACHERDGRGAAALREWSDLAARAAAANKPAQETLARRHVAELSSRLPRLRLGNEGAAERIELDDTPLDRALWSAAIPIDPGRHRLVFSRPGHKTATKSFEAAVGTTHAIDVPSLEPIETAPPASPPPEPTPPDRSRSAGIFLTAAGGVALGVGTYFGVAAIGHRSDSDDACPANRCTEHGVALNDRAITEAWVSNIAIASGLVLAGVGLYLLFRSDAPAHARAPSLTVSF